MDRIRLWIRELHERTRETLNHSRREVERAKRAKAKTQHLAKVLGENLQKEPQDRQQKSS